MKEVLEEEPLWTKLFAAVETENDDAKVADALVPTIREQNRKHGRTLLVMLENLGEILTRQIRDKNDVAALCKFENLGEILTRQIRDKNDVAALRKFLMADNGCLLLATAPLHFDGITDVGQPFYDFFDVQILENLSFEDTVEVIRLNLEWEERTDILETLEDMRPRLAGDVVAAQASHRCPLPTHCPTPARQAFAPLHDSRGILRHLARDESFPQRT